jgi:plastocyanin
MNGALRNAMKPISFSTLFRVSRRSPLPYLLCLLLLLVAGPASSAELRARIIDAAGKPVEDAVVIARSNITEATAAAARAEDNVVDQIDKEFVPHVKAILVGSLVHFPNKDNSRHHVYSFSPPKKFELPLYSGTKAPPVLFDKPGVVVLGCNIHDWMLGYIYVSETPHFGKSGRDGLVLLKDLPAGAYAVRVWHPRMKQAEEATVKNMVLETAAKADAEWQIELKPDTRIRRAPTPGAGRYQ